MRPVGAGNGLFTGRPFFRNDLITEYCGLIIDHQKALRLRKRGKATHVRVLNSQWLYIDGLKQPVTGQGGASFANDARNASAYNAVFVQRYVAVYDSMTPSAALQPCQYITAVALPPSSGSAQNGNLLQWRYR